MGLYQVLGMDKTNLTKMMVWESIYTAGAGILGGILAGIVFGRLIFLVLLKLIRFDVAFQFSVEPEAILICAGLFGAIFLVILIWNIFQVQRVNPVELLQGGKKGEKEPKANWLIAVIGILLLGSGYYIAQTTESPLSAITKFFIAVILVIFGTYALFTAGSVALLKLLKKNKAYYYKTKHFVSVSGLIYPMKQNAVLYKHFRYFVQNETKCSRTGKYLYYEYHCTGIDFCDSILVYRAGKYNEYTF